MKNVKVFIASSNDEAEEREALRNLLLKISAVTQTYGVAVVPEMWEMMSPQFCLVLCPSNMSIMRHLYLQIWCFSYLANVLENIHMRNSRPPVSSSRK